jgi:autotransporter-associated beta strand protein
MKPKNFPCRGRFILIVTSSIVTAISPARAAIYNWTGSTDSDFTNGSNWAENTWSQWDDYRFGGTPANASVNINGYFGIGSLNLENGLSQDIVINSTNAQPVIMNTAFANSGLALISIAAGSRDLTINGEYVSVGAVTWDVGSGRTLIMGAQFNNWFATASLIKNGAGTATLANTNGFSGKADVNAGILLATSNGALGTGSWSSNTMTQVYNGGTLALQGGISLNEHMHIVGQGVGGLGALRSISGTNSLTMTFSNSGSGPGLALDGDTTIGVDADTLTVTGFYHDPAYAGSALTKVGGGTLAFNQASTYTGGTVVQGGTIRLLGRNLLSASGGITVHSGASLITDAANGENTQNISSAITLNGGSLAAGIGASAQNFVEGNPVGAWGNYYLAPGASIQAGGDAVSTISASLGVNGPGGYTPINVSDGSTLEISGDITGVGYVSWGGFSKSGNGTLVLAGNNKSTSQGMILHAGIIEFANDSLPTNRRSSGGPDGYSADIQGNATLRWASGNTQDISFENSSRQIRIGDAVTATFDTNGNHVTLAHAFDLESGQTGALTKRGAGSLTLAASQSYSGTTTVGEGSLILGNGTQNTSLADSSDVVIESGASLQLNYAVENTDTIQRLYLEGMQAAAGTWGSPTSTAEHKSALITGTGLLHVISGPPVTDPFAAWMGTNYPNIVAPHNTPAADPDGDGIANLIEYILQGGDPSVSNPNILPTLDAAGNNFVFTFFRRTAATVTTQTFEYGTTLNTWTPVAIASGPGVLITDEGGGIQRVEVSVAKADNTQIFGRLQIVR